MKKLFLFFLSFAVIPNLIATACDQVFDGGMLRYNQGYTFGDELTNHANKKIYLNTYRVGFVNPSFLDKGGDFAWTSSLKSNGYGVDARSTMRVLQTTSPSWRIAKTPNQRTNGTRNSYDFGIEYTLTYDYSNNHPDTSDDKSHKECIYYSVSWCGDGVLEPSYGEVCDPNDPLKRGWGPSGCSTTCQPLHPPITQQPVCTGLTYQREDNVYTFRCTASQAGATYNLYDGSNLLATNTTGVFSNISLSNPGTITCRLANEVANNNPAPAVCTIPDIGGRLSCLSLTATPPTGAGVKTFTSTAGGTQTSLRHQLVGGGQTRDSGSTGRTHTFNNVTTLVNNQFRATVFDSAGNSATSQSCTFTVPDTPITSPTCGTAQRTFGASETGWGNFTFCTNGTPNPASPGFPSQGGNVSWTCNGASGTPVTCTANRLSDTTGGFSCDSLVANPASSHNTPLNTVLTCSATSTSLFNIEVRNSSQTVVASGSTSTLNVNNLGVGTYTATCRVGGQATAIPICTTTLNVTTGGGGGGGCTHGGIIGPQTNPITNTTPGLCETGRTAESFQFTVNGNTTQYSWQCSGQSGATCGASYTSGGGGGTPPGGGGGGGSYCGDGRLDRPNSSGMMEQCDFGGANPWSNWPAWCGIPGTSGACQIDETTSPGGYSFGPESTIPGGGTITIHPSGNVLIGHGMSVFGNANRQATITNDSNSDIYIDKKLCISQSDSLNVINGIQELCSSSEVGRLNAGRTRTLSVGENFFGTTDTLGTSRTFGDAKIITKIEGVPDTSFLNAVLDVRVAKPSIQSAGGGAGFVKGTNVSDVRALSTNFGPLNPELNRNLILTSLGVGALSSNVGKEIQVGNLLQTSREQGKQDVQALGNITVGGTQTARTTLPTEKFQGINNVFIHKGNLTLNNVSGVGANSTYIVEGNLTLNGNISSDHSILFVVKNGNITIGKDVTQIDAILIAMDQFIESDGAKTNNILTVNGALYGDISKLIESRTYVKGRGEYVDVGTNVQFTSKVFTSPPPLLSKFLGEFIQGDKMAR